jgi:uncharacterized membrane protein
MQRMDEPEPMAPHQWRNGIKWIGVLLAVLAVFSSVVIAWDAHMTSIALSLAGMALVLVTRVL